MEVADLLGLYRDCAFCLFETHLKLLDQFTLLAHFLVFLDQFLVQLKLIWIETNFVIGWLTFAEYCVLRLRLFILAVGTATIGLAGKTLIKAKAVVRATAGTQAATHPCAGDTIHGEDCSLRLGHTIGGILTAGARAAFRVAIQPRVKATAVAGVAMAALAGALDSSSCLSESHIQRLRQLLGLFDDSSLSIALVSTHDERLLLIHVLNVWINWLAHNFFGNFIL